MYMYVFVDIYACMQLLCMNVRIYVCIYVLINTLLCVYIYVCMCVFMYL